MIEWADEGTVLSLRRHGETSAIVEVFTSGHGRHAGIVRGGASRRMAPILQPGGQVAVTWKARLDEHLGTFTIEPRRSRPALVTGDRLALAGLNAIAALLIFILPERDPHPALYDRTSALLDLAGQPDLWPLAYLHWEMALLEEAGFALDLSRCAATGRTTGLAYISPRTGRAVSAEGAGDWADRLLPLPSVLLGQGEAGPEDMRAAFEITGHFITKSLLPSLGDRPVPPARQRLIDLICRAE